MTETYVPEPPPPRRVTACALVRSPDGGVLVVKPCYRSDDDWLLPGGAVEAGETPRAACAREVLEELGVAIPVGRLLCVDYQTPRGSGPAGVHFLFDAGVADAETASQFVLPADELSAFKFCQPDEAARLLSRPLVRRLKAILSTRSEPRIIYMENGIVVEDGQQ